MPTVSRKRALPPPDPATLMPPVLACPGALAPFLRRAPVPVLVRSCLKWLVERAELNALFERTAEEHPRIDA